MDTNHHHAHHRHRHRHHHHRHHCQARRPHHPQPPQTTQEKKASEKKQARSKWNERWNTVADQREKHGNPQMPTYMQKSFTTTREEEDAYDEVADAVLGSYEGESEDGGFY